MNPDFEVLRGIARRVNSTNQRIGQILNEYGYRDPKGVATKLARQLGWAVPYRLWRGGSSWKWNVQWVLEWLEELAANNPGIITPKKIPQPRKK